MKVSQKTHLQRYVFKELLIQLQHSEEGLLRYFHIANLLHALLASLLLLQQFALTAHITTVALGGNVLAYLLDSLTSNDLGSDGCLYGNIELLSWNQLFQLLTHTASQIVGIALVGEGREGIDRLTIEQDVELDELGWTEP